jgi:hypothetical protein
MQAHLVELQGFLEAILPEHQVAQVGIETRQPQAVALPGEDLASALRIAVRFFIAAQVQKALQGAVEGAGELHLQSGGFVNGDGLAVELQRRREFAAHAEDVSQGAEAGGAGGLVAHVFGEPHGGARHPLGLRDVHVHQANRFVVKARHGFGPPEMARAHH